MKHLIIGGASQGKRQYVLDRLAVPERNIADGGAANIEAALAKPCVDKLHLLVRRLMEAGADPSTTVLSALDGREDWLILSDEIGAGIVPIDPVDRRWREEVGRLCCDLAARADRVERIVCGLPQRLKG